MTNDECQMPNAKRVLILSSTVGYQLRSFGESAERLGIELTFGTDRCRHLDDPWRDHAVAVRWHEPERSLAAVVDAARERPMAGVIAVGDRPVGLAADVAAALGLPGNPPRAAALSANKAECRRVWTAAGLPSPWVVIVPPDESAEQAADRVRYPCVLKPLGLSGSRGVIRADSPAALLTAIARVRRLLARSDVKLIRRGMDDTLLIEDYIPGAEFAIEGLLTGGVLRVLAIFDKPDPLEGPFFEETIYVTPSALLAQTQQAIADAVQQGCAALGLRHGPVHAECRVHADGVFLLEIAARPIGGLCSRVLRFRSTDLSIHRTTDPPIYRSADAIPLEELLLRHAVGEETSQYAREARAAGVMMIPIPKRGVYKGATGEDAARAVAGVEDVRITAKCDQVLEPLPEAGSYLGFIFARGDSPAEVTGALRAAHARLRFIVDPLLDVSLST
jgi:hypothetical protein